MTADAEHCLHNALANWPDKQRKIKGTGWIRIAQVERNSDEEKETSENPLWPLHPENSPKAL